MQPNNRIVIPQELYVILLQDLLQHIKHALFQYASDWWEQT